MPTFSWQAVSWVMSCCVFEQPITVGLGAGALRPVLVDLNSAGKALGLPFLAHADLQPAACLLMLLEATSDETPCEGIHPNMALTSYCSSECSVPRDSGMWLLCVSVRRECERPCNGSEQESGTLQS